MVGQCRDEKRGGRRGRGRGRRRTLAFGLGTGSGEVVFVAIVRSHYVFECVLVGRDWGVV